MPVLRRVCCVWVRIWATQQIFLGESLAGLLVPILHPDLCQRRDILRFVENMRRSFLDSSCQRTPSRSSDCNLRARVWYEWTDPASNPSDGVSRGGLKDAWSLVQGWSLQEYDFPSSLLCFLSVLKCSGCMKSSGCLDLMSLESLAYQSWYVFLQCIH